MTPVERDRSDRNRLLAIGFAISLLVALFNVTTTGDWDGHPGEHCMDNPRTNDVTCFPDRP